MKRIIFLFLFLTISTTASSAELSQKSLQGNWAITEFMGMAEKGDDMWQFEKNEFRQNLSGVRMRPDKFTISPNTIDLGYHKIKVTSFDGKVMYAIMGGAKYKLVKQ